MNVVHVAEPLERPFAVLVHALVQSIALQLVRDLNPARSLLWCRRALRRYSLRARRRKNAQEKEPNPSLASIPHIPPWYPNALWLISPARPQPVQPMPACPSSEM